MTKIIGKIRGYKALLYLGDKIIVSRQYEIFFADLDLTRLDYICTVGTTNPLVRIILRFRLLQRLFRMDLGPAVVLDQNDCFLVFRGDQLFHVDTTLCVASPEYVPGLKHRPLQVTRSKSPESAGSIYFGEYTENSEYGPVNIYRRDKAGTWSVIFSFSSGEINHIHGVFEDVGRSCFYILTGDFDQGACIWLADLAFTEVKPLVRSGQESRACWIFPWDHRLIFATDQQANLNYLCEIGDVGKASVSKKFPIVGSSIFFSSSHSNTIIFSTAVEPVSCDKLSFGWFFPRLRALGVLSNNSCIYIGTPDKGFDIIFSDRKDWYHFGLFQFGNICFPAGDSSDGTYLHFFGVALKDADNSTYAMKIDKEKLAQICVA
jgi:hypothetical protein